MARDRRLIARTALLLAVLVAAAALLRPLPREPAVTGGERAQGSDVALYQAIAARVAGGEAYVPTAMAEQRARNFPVRPGPAVRPPALAQLMAYGEAPARILFFGLLAATLVVWARQGAAAGLRPILIALLLLSIGLPVAMHALGPGLWFHESWAGLLVALSLGAWRPGAWRASLAAGLAAMLLREFALGFGAAMLAMALAERRRGEAAGWVVAIAIAGVALGWHWSLVAASALPGDPASPGWSGLLGPGFALDSLRQMGLLAAAPLALAAPLLALALAGWSMAGAVGRRVLIAQAGWLLMLATLARPDNFYWAALALPLSLGGLLFLPRLLAAARGGKDGAMGESHAP